MTKDEKIALAFNAAYTIQRFDPDTIKHFLGTDNKNNEIVVAVAEGIKYSKREKIIKQQEVINERKLQKKPKR